MRWCVLVAAVVVLAGCGSEERAAPPSPTLPHTQASAWRAQADSVAAALAADDGCLALERAAALRTSVIRAVNRRLVAPRLQEPLLGAVNDLASRIRCVVPAAPADDEQGDGGHGKHGGEHGKGTGDG